MTTEEFLSQLRSLNVQFWSDGERLRCNAPQSVLTPELWAELRSRKEEILAFLREAGATVNSRVPALRSVSRSGYLPLSFAQQRLWFFDQLEKDSGAYNITKTVYVVGPLNVDALRRSLNAIVTRHEVLRTVFATSNGEPVQVISDNRVIDLKTSDFTQVAADALETEIQRLLKEEARRPFKLSSDLMLRATLLKVKPEGHVLQLVMHHIASDGWSMGVLFREVFALYEAFSNDRPSPLPDLPIQYADFAVWQKEWLRGEVLDAQVNYWKKQLAGVPELLEFPTDRPRPTVQSYHGAWESVLFSEAESEAIRSLSRREGTTLFMTLLTVFKILLHRYTEQNDIVVGSSTAGRNCVEIEGLIGFFVNMLVLRTDLSGDPTFRELLGRVRETALGAYAHQDLPFEKLVEELQPKRALDHHPLFQVAFDLESGTSRTLNLAGLTTFPIPVQDGVAKFDLTLFMADTGKALGATLEYNTDLFDRTTIRRMLGHLQTLLHAILANPDERISRLEILPEVEKRQLAQCNDMRSDYPKDRTIHQVFEAVAARYPDRIAVVCGEEQMAYGELNERANRLAHYLRKLGVGPEVLVGICLERSLEMVVGLLGVLKAGGAYVPLDPAYPKERLAFMLEDHRAPVLITQRSLIERLPTSNATVLCLDRDWGEISSENQDNPLPLSTPDNLAYVIYTSGSTGVPKGALIEHYNVVRLFRATGSWFHFSPDDVWTLFHSYAFDFSVWELWGALLHGGRLVIVPFEVSRSPHEFYDLLCREQVTVLNQTPSAFRLFLGAEESIIEPSRLRLRLVIFGGEALDFQSLKPWFDRHGDQRPRLINMYGITETTVHVTYRVIKETDLHPGMSSLIGVPIPDLELYVLDPYRNLVPVGVPGELYVGGAGLGRGYLNRAELTAERFVIHSIDNGKGRRLYRSGDLVRRRADGDIDYLGRIDSQVKIRGHRIELGEIEAVLREHPAVRDVVVLAREDVPKDKRLVGYVVSADSAPTTGELRRFLQRKLPDYMLPAMFVFMESFPLTPNGKIDRPALPAPSGVGSENLPAINPPKNDLERQLVQIWENELAVRPISIRDNFFDLGGHSLLAVRVFARMEQVLGVRLPLAELFHTPTVEGLAEVIRGGTRSSSWRSLVPIQVGGSRPPLFAVPGVGGNVFCYADLARLLAPEQPFYGLQSRGLDGSEKPLTSIEEIAASFLKEMREMQPIGPYYLMGACMGGVVAYEMAQQLRVAGQEVGLLIFLETWLPGSSAKGQFRAAVRVMAALHLIISRLRSYVGNFIRLRGRQRFEYLLDRLGMLGQMIVQRDVFRGDRSEFNLRLVTEANLVALQKYRPDVYPGRVVLFRAEDRIVISDDDPRFAWSRLVIGDLEVHSVLGDNSGTMLMNPYVGKLARKLEACIKGAQLIAAFVGPAIEPMRLVLKMVEGT